MFIRFPTLYPYTNKTTSVKCNLETDHHAYKQKGTTVVLQRKLCKHIVLMLFLKWKLIYLSNSSKKWKKRICSYANFGVSINHFYASAVNMFMLLWNLPYSCLHFSLFFSMSVINLCACQRWVSEKLSVESLRDLELFGGEVQGKLFNKTLTVHTKVFSSTNRKQHQCHWFLCCFSSWYYKLLLVLCAVAWHTYSKSVRFYLKLMVI